MVSGRTNGGRGVDDVLQVTRRIVEEGTASRPSNAVMLIRLFDIEKRILG